MNRQKREQLKREQLIRESSKEGEQHDRSQHDRDQQERMKGSESMKDSQKMPAPQRQSGRLPLPD